MAFSAVTHDPTLGQYPLEEAAELETGLWAVLQDLSQRSPMRWVTGRQTLPLSMAVGRTVEGFPSNPTKSQGEDRRD